MNKMLAGSLFLGSLNIFICFLYFKLSNKLASINAVVTIYHEALAQIADPRLRPHREPNAYTELGCVMNIANEALSHQLD